MEHSHATPVLIGASFAGVLTCSTLASPFFENTGSQTMPGDTFAVQHDGRLLAIDGSAILRETAVHSQAFDIVGIIPDGLIAPWGASFLEISPDGEHILIGDNNFNGANVLLINTVDLIGGELSPIVMLHENFNADWVTTNQIAISYGNPTTFMGEVAILDITTGVSTVVIHIDGAAGGVVVDGNLNVLAGNGWDFDPNNGSDVGDVKVFDGARIQDIISNAGAPFEFASEGTLVLNRLSAAGLHFDSTGNLFVGGSNPNEGDFFAIADDNAVATAIAGGQPVPTDSFFVDDPVGAPDTFYAAAEFNDTTGQWFVNGGDGTLYLYLESSCLGLSVDHLIANTDATFTVTGGTPGERAAVAFGFETGESVVQNKGTFCATFGIAHVTANRRVARSVQVFDGLGVAVFEQQVPTQMQGHALYFQAAASGTCGEDDCTSEVVHQVVQ